MPIWYDVEQPNFFARFQTIGKGLFFRGPSRPGY